MARRQCRWCGVPTVVPLEAQSLRCPTCLQVTTLQTNYYGYRPPGVNGDVNLMARPGGTRPYGHSPMNGGGVYQVQSQPYPPPAFGRKRAVLCGITYKESTQSLKGSVNDVVLMRKLLVERFGFPPSAIIMLTEEQDYKYIPTKQNVRAALRWLVQGSQPGDSMVFHYSGHGSQVKDRDGDEVDGYDESLLPVDYQTEGRILDDELNATIVRPLPKGTTLHSIIDTCFSGTFLDLPNVCRINRQGNYRWEDHSIRQVSYKGTNGGLAISISACDDHQNSGDTTAFGPATGALTYSFVQTLQQEPRITYGRLLLTMYNKIRAARDGLGLNSNAPHLAQEPQLSSSFKFEIHSKPFAI